jgi:hypothetical protein
MTHKRVYNVNQDDVKASLDVMTGIITLNSLKRFIQPNNSPWRAPVLFVKKKDEIF